MLKLKGLVLACALLLIGCGGSGSGGGGQARIRLLNGMVGQSTIYAQFLDFNQVVLGTSPNAAFGATAADTAVSATTATAAVWGATGQLETTPATLLQGNTDYTLYTYGYALYGLHGLLVVDSQVMSVGSTIGVRLVQVGFNNRTIDAYVLPPATPLNSATVLFSSLSTGAVSSGVNTDLNGYLVLSATSGLSYTATITAPGSQTVLTSAAFTATQGHYYTVVVFDSAIGAANRTSVIVLDDNRS